MCHLKYFMDNCKEGVRKRCLSSFIVQIITLLIALNNLSVILLYNSFQYLQNWKELV